ncbi:MAG: hypothetical protein ABII90_06000 [Bacteroidota bacterium]
MKTSKFLLSAALAVSICICFQNEAISQSGTKYATGGNNLSGSDRFGSNNYAGINIYTNSIQRGIITQDGWFGWGTTTPSAFFNVSGGDALFEMNVTIDSLLSVGLLIVNGVSQFNGLAYFGNLTVDGANSSFSSSTGTIDFLNTNLLTTANITADTITGNVINTNYFSTGQGLLNSLQVTGQTQTGSLLVDGDATVNGTTSVEMLHATSLQVDNGVTTQTLAADTVSVSRFLTVPRMQADTVSVTRFQTVARLDADTIVSGSINSGQYLLNGSPLTGSQWINSGSDIYFSGGNVGININNPQYPLHVDGNAVVTGSVGAQDLYVQNTINIGDFKFKNGGIVPVPPATVKDSISSSKEIVIRSEAEKIELSSDTVLIKSVMKAKTVKTDTLKTETLETEKEIRIKGMVIDGVNSRITSTSGNIYFDDENLITTGSIGGQNLYAQNSVNIGAFKFINGAIQPGQKDTIKSPAEIVVRSEAEKISFSSDTVTAKEVLVAQTVEAVKKIKAPEIETDTLNVKTIKSQEEINVANGIILDGINSRIISPSGTISLDDENLITTGSIGSKELYVQKAVNIGDFRFKNGAMLPGQKDTISSTVDMVIESKAKKIQLFSDTVTAKYAFKAQTVEASIGIKAPEIETDTLKAKTVKSDSAIEVANGLVIDGISSRITAPGGNIYFDDENLITTGSIVGQNLYVQNAINIGSFEFKNGATQPGQKDSIKSTVEMVFKSEAEKITLSSDTVYAKNVIQARTIKSDTLSAKTLKSDSAIKVAGSGLVIDGINNKITSASGTISLDDDNLVTSGSLVSQDLYVQRAINIGDFEFKNGATMPGQKDTISSTVGIVLESAAEMITLSSDSVVAKEVIKAKTIEADTLKTETLETEKEIRVKGMVIDGVNSRITAGSGVISFDDEDLVTTGLINATRLNVDSANFERLETKNIVSPDSLIYFGDSTIVITTDNTNRIYGHGTYGNYKGLGLGVATRPKGNRSTAIGYKVSIDDVAENAIVIGSGLPGKSTPWLENTEPNSLMIGFNSDLPTMFVMPAKGAGYIGKVGIGTTNPAVALDINGQLRMRPNAVKGYIMTSDATGIANWAPPASISDGDWEVTGNGDVVTGVVGNIGGYPEGNVGIGTDSPDPDSKLHIYQVPGHYKYKKAIQVETAKLHFSGSTSAFHATGETDFPGVVKGTYNARIGYASAASTLGIMIGGIYGYVKPEFIHADPSYTAFATGSTCIADLDNLGVNSAGATWVGGIYGEIKGTISSSNYHPIGAIAAVIGIDNIKGEKTYAGYFDGGVYIEGNLNHKWTQNNWNVVLQTPLASAAWRSTITASNGKYLGIGMTTAGWYWIMSDKDDHTGTCEYPMYLSISGAPTLNVCKVKVSTATWCDHIFDDNHKRMTPKQKSIFYKENKHLFGLPTGKEIEENGLDVGEILEGVTLNVEENSLDIIDHDEKIEELEQENKELTEKIKQFEIRLKRIEAKH